MAKEQKYITIAKPFVKWAGGKGSLIKQLIECLPQDFAEQQNVTYIEPFVGGGAMLFYMLAHYPNIKRAIINDVNEDLINCYLLIKENPTQLIVLLRNIKDEYYKLATLEEKTRYYYQMRERYNNDEFAIAERAACFIFLNKTCFNGLYRVNTNGKFNVPFGKYERPNICDEELIMADHRILQDVDIFVGEYKNITKHLGKRYNFIYIDPPYRPLSGSACFIEYSHNIFNDTEQEKLKVYCDMLTQKGCKIMQSNSNSIDYDGISYFTKLYSTYTISQILAHRFINAHAGKRDKQTELLIMNY
ncbi:MAG: Dam family site-specific DNA-(adenine-N6)-methyltransferase [Bacteroides sp.]|nr:Dam family site-specific DNA-(adenine-N6)-methyltransferase [Bacteroides sp.]